MRRSLFKPPRGFFASVMSGIRARKESERRVQEILDKSKEAGDEFIQDVLFYSDYYKHTNLIEEDIHINMIFEHSSQPIRDILNYHNLNRDET